MLITKGYKDMFTRFHNLTIILKNLGFHTGGPSFRDRRRLGRRV